MNEQLLKNIIKYKFNLANKFVDCLPEKASNEVKNMGKIILKSLEEALDNNEDQSVETKTDSNGLKNVPIK